MKKKVLSFGAHPDDIELGCGGTEVLLIGQGYEVYHVFMTSGEAGSQTSAPDELKRIRESEAGEAAAVLGARVMAFLEYPDGLTFFTRDMKIEVINLIRSVRPDIVFVHASNDMVTDHKVVHDLVLSALTGAAGPWFQETAGNPWRPGSVYGYEVWHPLDQFGLAVDISKSIEKKMEALARHHSQVGERAYDAAFRGLARYRGVMSGMGEYAEVFEVITTTFY